MPNRRLPRPGATRGVPMALALVPRDRLPDTEPSQPQPDAVGDTTLCGASLRQLRALLLTGGAPREWVVRLNDAITLNDRALKALVPPEDYPVTSRGDG